MSRILRSPADIKARSRRLGMVAAAPADVALIERTLPARNSARERVAGETMRRNGFEDQEIEAALGYLPLRKDGQT